MLYYSENDQRNNAIEERKNKQTASIELTNKTNKIA